MKCVLALSPRAIEALRDITYLPGRDESVWDLKDRPDGLHYSRITHVALIRSEFAELQPETQATYLYRIAGCELMFPWNLLFPVIVTVDRDCVRSHSKRNGAFEQGWFSWQISC